MLDGKEVASPRKSSGGIPKTWASFSRSRSLNSMRCPRLRCTKLSLRPMWRQASFIEMPPLVELAHNKSRTASVQCFRPAGRRHNRAAKVRMYGGADSSGTPKGPKNGNYKHGRYTKEVAATRRWLREATSMLRDLNKCPG